MTYSYTFDKVNSKWDVIGQKPLPNIGAFSVNVAGEAVYVIGRKNPDGQFTNNLLIGHYKETYNKCFTDSIVIVDFLFL